jgi:hypothetical protein
MDVELGNLRMFENRVLRRTFATKRDEVTGGWRKMHNVELKIFIFLEYNLTIKIR